jgi:hypothetical protein
MTSIAVPFLAKMGQGSVKYKHRLKNSEDFSVLATPHRTGIGQKKDRCLIFLTEYPAETHNLPIKTEKSALRCPPLADQSGKTRFLCIRRERQRAPHPRQKFNA